MLADADVLVYSRRSRGPGARTMTTDFDRLSMLVLVVIALISRGNSTSWQMNDELNGCQFEESDNRTTGLYCNHSQRLSVTVRHFFLVGNVRFGI